MAVHAKQQEGCWCSAAGRGDRYNLLLICIGKGDDGKDNVIVCGCLF